MRAYSTRLELRLALHCRIDRGKKSAHQGVVFISYSATRAQYPIRAAFDSTDPSYIQIEVSVIANEREIIPEYQGINLDAGVTMMRFEREKMELEIEEQNLWKRSIKIGNNHELEARWDWRR